MNKLGGNNIIRFMPIRPRPKDLGHKQKKKEDKKKKKGFLAWLKGFFGLSSTDDDETNQPTTA
jgi:hypothetical protein